MAELQKQEIEEKIKKGKEYHKGLSENIQDSIKQRKEVYRSQVLNIRENEYNGNELMTDII